MLEGRGAALRGVNTKSELYRVLMAERCALAFGIQAIWA